MSPDIFCSVLSTDIFAITFSIGIFIFALFWLVAFLKEIKPVISQLSKMIPMLEAQQGELEFRKNFDELNNVFKESSVLGHHWHEFVEGTLLSENSVKNTKEAGHYFNRDTVLYGYVNLSFYNSLPNILTGLGILGTFLGLLSGVSQVSIKDITTIEALLGGAAVAFSTSIAGLLSSIVFTLILKFFTFKIDALIQKWVTALDRRLEWISPEKVTYQLFMQQIEQSKIMEAFAEKIGLSIREVLNRDRNSQLSVLKEIRGQLSNHNSDISKEFIEVQTQKIQKAINNLYNGLTEKNNQIISIAKEYSDSLIFTINNAFNDNTETLKAFQGSTRKQLDGIQTTNEKSLSQAISGFELSSNNFNSLVSIINNAFNDNTETLKAFQGSTRKQLDGIQTTNEKSLSQAISGFELSSNNFNSLVSIINNAFNDNTETLKAFQGSTRKQLDGIQTTNEKSLSKTTSEFELLNNNFNDFMSQLTENNSNALIEALEIVIRDFNLKITEQFGDNFKQLNEAVGQLLIWQNNYRDTIEQTFKNLDLQLKRTESATEAIEKQSNSIVSISKSLKKCRKESCQAFFVVTGYRDSGRKKLTTKTPYFMSSCKVFQFWGKKQKRSFLQFQAMLKHMSLTLLILWILLPRGLMK